MSTDEFWSHGGSCLSTHVSGSSPLVVPWDILKMRGTVDVFEIMVMIRNKLHPIGEIGFC